MIEIASFTIAKERRGRREPPFPSKARETVLGNGMQYHQSPRVLKRGVETVSEREYVFQKSPCTLALACSLFQYFI